MIGRSFLPIFRSYVAKELVEKYKFTQIEVAEKLGTTQAAISQYLRSKRGHGGLSQFEDILPLIKSAASNIAEEIASGRIS